MVNSVKGGGVVHNFYLPVDSWQSLKPHPIRVRLLSQRGARPKCARWHLAKGAKYLFIKVPHGTL